jgi:sterol desaturase/sphingolipid hydroxylase (fatty acid hydroxylase superfamily)
LTEVVLSGVAGALGWSAAEYAIHRGLGHDPARRRNPFTREHLKHHADGHYFAPSLKKAAVALPVLAGLAALLVPLLGAGRGLGFGLGFALAYTAYEVLHRRLHTHAPRGPYGRWARRHHFYHHFMDPRSNHGVTSPVWDLVFGTYASPGVVRVPRRQAMRWLLEPDSGEVRQAYAQGYRLAGGAGSR